MKTTLIPTAELSSVQENCTPTFFSSDTLVELSKEKESTNYQDLISYYQKATQDYKFWSENFHMHFGFYEKGMNPLDLEKMLLQMTKEVFKRLNIASANETVSAIDLGCGVGTSARYFAQFYPNAHIRAVTLVREQIEIGKFLLDKTAKQQKNIEFTCANYENTPFLENSFDVAYAIESSCYGNGKDKFEFLEEASRLLKSGGRLVVADGFLKHGNKLPFGINKIYKKTCECWALSEMGQIHPFVEAMKKVGFENIKVEDVSWRVAPSVAHVPYISLKFLFKQIQSKSIFKLHQEQKNNVFAPLMTMLLGLARNHFSYYIVSVTKK